MTKKDDGEALALGGSVSLKEALASLDRSGINQYFYQIRRREPDSPRFPMWKYKVPVDEVDDIADFCYRDPDGGEQYEYKVTLMDASGKPVKLPNGKGITSIIVPALVVGEPSGGSSHKGKKGENDLDQSLKERERDLFVRRKEIQLQREEANLERERRRMEKQLNGEDEDDDEDEVINPNLMNPYMNPYMMMPPPWMQQPKPDDTLKFLLPILLKMLDRPTPQDSGLRDVMPLLVAAMSGKDPKEMFTMIGPMMTAMGQMQANASKVMMESMSDNDRLLKKKLIEMIEVSGGSDDEIDKWKRILGLVTDGVTGVAKVFFRGKAGKGDKVDVPLMGGRKEEPRGLPAPAGRTENPPAKPATPDDPKAKAREAVAQRVRLFLEAHEQEMLIGSDPALCADKLDELYASLPQALREKVEGSDVGTIYELLHGYDAQIVERILKSVEDDKSGNAKEWCKAFWDLLLHPPEEDEDDDGGDDGDGGEEEPDGDDGGEKEPAPDKADGGA